MRSVNYSLKYYKNICLREKSDTCSVFRQPQKMNKTLRYGKSGALCVPSKTNEKRALQKMCIKSGGVGDDSIFSTNIFQSFGRMRWTFSFVGIPSQIRRLFTKKNHLFYKELTFDDSSNILNVSNESFQFVYRQCNPLKLFGHFLQKISSRRVFAVPFILLRAQKTFRLGDRIFQITLI